MREIVLGKGIDVIMPVFNEEKHLEACLNSIVEQDFKDWKLYAVNDFSTDSSKLILERFALLDNRIHCFENNEKGIISALRLAYSKGNNRFVTRMDADDIMVPNKLKTLHRHLQNQLPKTLVTGKVQYFSDGQIFNGFRKYEDWINQMVEKNSFFKEIYKECCIPSACWMAFRKDLDKIQAFEESIYPEDYDLVFKMYGNGWKTIGISQVLHLWRDHPKRASRNDPNYADQKFFNLKLKYFLSIDYKDQVPLFLWGAGKKGKALARLLLDKKIDFKWISDNPEKIGKSIYGVSVIPSSELKMKQDKQVIVAISSRVFSAQKLKMYERLNLKGNELFEFL